MQLKTLVINLALFVFVSLTLLTLLDDMSGKASYSTTLNIPDNDTYFSQFRNSSQKLNTSLSSVFTSMKDQSQNTTVQGEEDGVLSLGLINVGPVVEALKLIFTLPSVIMDTVSVMAATISAYTYIEMQYVVMALGVILLGFFTIMFVEAMLKWRLGG